MAFPPGLAIALGLKQREAGGNEECQETDQQLQTCVAAQCGGGWQRGCAAATEGGANRKPTHECGEHGARGRDTMPEAKRQQPSLSLDWIERYHPLVRSEDHARYIEGLKKAGLN